MSHTSLLINILNFTLSKDTQPSTCKCHATTPPPPPRHTPTHTHTHTKALGCVVHPLTHQTHIHTHIHTYTHRRRTTTSQCHSPPRHPSSDGNESATSLRRINRNKEFKWKITLRGLCALLVTSDFHPQLRLRPLTTTSPLFGPFFFSPSSSFDALRLSSADETAVTHSSGTLYGRTHLACITQGRPITGQHRDRRSEHTCDVGLTKFSISVSTLYSALYSN